MRPKEELNSEIWVKCDIWGKWVVEKLKYLCALLGALLLLLEACRSTYVGGGIKRSGRV